MPVLLKCLPRPRFGVLHVLLVISTLDSECYLIEINLKKDNYFHRLHADGIVSLEINLKEDNCFYYCTPMGLSPLISISIPNFGNGSSIISKIANQEQSDFYVFYHEPLSASTMGNVNNFAIGDYISHK